MSVDLIFGMTCTIWCPINRSIFLVIANLEPDPDVLVVLELLDDGVVDGAVLHPGRLATGGIPVPQQGRSAGRHSTKEWPDLILRGLIIRNLIT